MHPEFWPHHVPPIGLTGQAWASSVSASAAGAAAREVPGARASCLGGGSETVVLHGQEEPS